MNIPTEHQEQVAVVDWCNANGLKAIAVANGFHTNGKRDKRFYGMMAALKKEGYSKGFPDLIIIAPNGKTMFIEMKRVKGSVTSPEQKAWESKLYKMGHYSAICKGADDAILVIKEWL